jgi:hypothetical protein
MNNYASKIEALLRKAEGASTAEEAEAYSKAAERLMIKWGIDDAMVAEAATSKVTVEAIIEKTEYQEGRLHMAYQMLAANVATGLGNLKVLQTRHPNKTRTHIIGHESDVARFFTLFHSLKIQADGAMREWWKTEKEQHRGWYGEVDQGESFKARRQFIISFGWAVNERLRTARTAEVESAGAELVFVGREKRVDNFVSELYPKLHRPRGRKMQGSWSGQAAGRAAGARANLNAQQSVSQ